MINSTVREDITPKVVLKRLTEWGGKLNNLNAVDLSDLTAVFSAFLDLSDKNREIFLNGIDAFVCRECGQPSCLCGYSDE